MAPKNPLPNRFEVWLVELDPVRGSEIAKTRPCVVVSPDVANRQLRTVLVAPLTSTVRHLPIRVATIFDGQPGEMAFDQLRAVDRSRLRRCLGTLDHSTALAACLTLQQLFAY